MHRIDVAKAATAVAYQADPAAIERLYQDASTVKLFYSEHYKYNCYSANWGASKGSDHYGDVCVVLSADNVKAYLAGNLRSINVQTRNKLYVACSRARGNLTFVPAKASEPSKRKRTPARPNDKQSRVKR